VRRRFMREGVGVRGHALEPTERSGALSKDHRVYI
jgi:hypothetical protein